MKSDHIIQQLSGFVAENILKQPDRAILPDESLITSGLIDSFSLIDLALFVEEQFGVHIDDTELNAETFDSLHELASIIEQRRSST
jgi:acyl carrier protein